MPTMRILLAFTASAALVSAACSRTNGAFENAQPSPLLDDPKIISGDPDSPSRTDLSSLQKTIDMIARAQSDLTNSAVIREPVMVTSIARTVEYKPDASSANRWVTDVSFAPAAVRTTIIR